MRASTLMKMYISLRTSPSEENFACTACIQCVGNTRGFWSKLKGYLLTDHVHVLWLNNAEAYHVQRSKWSGRFIGRIGETVDVTPEILVPDDTGIFVRWQGDRQTSRRASFQQWTKRRHLLLSDRATAIPAAAPRFETMHNSVRLLNPFLVLLWLFSCWCLTFFVMSWYLCSYATNADAGCLVFNENFSLPDRSSPNQIRTTFGLVALNLNKVYNLKMKSIF